MDILSRPWALLTLNDLTMLLNSLTISGCNEMDSEREGHKKSLGEEFVGEILLDKFVPMLVIKSNHKSYQLCQQDYWFSHRFCRILQDIVL